jgi:hypothetical protein
MSAPFADQHQIDETFRPDWATHLPGHPASFVRLVCTVGSPQSCSGLAIGAQQSRVDSVAET